MQMFHFGCPANLHMNKELDTENMHMVSEGQRIAARTESQETISGCMSSP